MASTENVHVSEETTAILEVNSNNHTITTLEEASNEELDKNGSRSKTILIVAGTAGGIVGLLVFLVVCICVVCISKSVKRKSTHAKREKRVIESDSRIDSHNTSSASLSEVHLQMNEAYTGSLTKNTEPLTSWTIDKPAVLLSDPMRSAEKAIGHTNTNIAYNYGNQNQVYMDNVEYGEMLSDVYDEPMGIPLKSQLSRTHKKEAILEVETEDHTYDYIS